MINSEGFGKEYIIQGTVLFSPSKGMLTHLDSGQEKSILMSSSLCFLTLIARHGEVVSHSDLIRCSWGKNSGHVSNSVLYQTILLLRNSLEQIGLPRNLIRTIPRRGFVILGEIKITEENQSSENPSEGGRSCEEKKDEIKDTISLPDQKKMRNREYKKIAFFSLWISSGIFILFYVYIAYKPIGRVFATYNYPVRDVLGEKDCRIYSETPLMRKNITPSLELFIHSTCHNNDSIYIPKISNAERVGFFVCDKDIQKKDGDCKSYYFIHAGD